ncbi:MAG: hypothetical protein ACXVRK_02740 [Gaiellaceae bacterium]
MNAIVRREVRPDPERASSRHHYLRSGVICERRLLAEIGSGEEFAQVA